MRVTVVHSSALTNKSLFLSLSFVDFFSLLFSAVIPLSFITNPMYYWVSFIPSFVGVCILVPLRINFRRGIIIDFCRESFKRVTE